MEMQLASLPHEEVLEELGLSRNDSKVYLCLLRAGPHSITVLAKNCEIHRANVYSALERLKVKGLISETQRENKKVFQASDPSCLVNLLKEKEIKLQSMMPQLILDHQLSKRDNHVEVYQGVNALRNIYKSYLEIGEPIYTFGVPKIAISLIGEYFQGVIHKRRAEKKQWIYHIYNSDAKERVKFLNTLPYSKTRYFDSEYDFPVTTRICGDEVSITLYSQNPLHIIIKSSEMAASYRKYFQILWDKAKDK